MEGFHPRMPLVRDDHEPHFSKPFCISNNDPPARSIAGAAHASNCPLHLRDRFPVKFVGWHQADNHVVPANNSTKKIAAAVLWVR